MYKDRYPEQWLKGCFRDLQSVFETFDGSMLASLVMGLIDNDTGLFYFINAEHPWTVLYRDKKASFIDTDMYIHKIGTIFNNDLPFQVHTFPLLHNDMIFLGSDGRDDIQLGMDNKGFRIINEDENLFLQHVRQGQGDLQKIASLIENKGSLTDDFTLLKIEYNNQSQKEDNYKMYKHKFLEAMAQYRQKKYLAATALFLKMLKNTSIQYDPLLLKSLGKSYFHQKKYQDAAYFFAIANFHNPEKGYLLFLTSLAYKFDNQYNNAADFAERLRIRRPRNIRNLVHLADIYRLLENFARAEKILSQALKLDPKHPAALSLIKKMKSIVNPKQIF